MSVKNEVLLSLQQNSDSYISGQSLSESLGVSRAAVCKAVSQLRRDGYVIDAMTNRGYRLPSDSELVTEADIRGCLPPHLRGMSVKLYDITDSTNIRARESAGDTQLPALFFANQQTAGRGRLGRRFHSPGKGIYMSLAIKPAFSLDKATLVTVAAAAAVARAVEDLTGETARIKWVNDIYIGDRKICGILTEATTDFESGQIESLIIGIGINTSTEGFPEELSGIAGGVSLDFAPSRARAKAALAARITQLLLQHLDELPEGINPPKSSYDFMDTYRSKSLLPGNHILVFKGTYRKDPTVELGGIPAFARGIDDEGGLVVEYENGDVETLTSGEVSVRRRTD